MRAAAVFLLFVLGLLILAALPDFLAESRRKREPGRAAILNRRLQEDERAVLERTNGATPALLPAEEAVRGPDVGK